MRPPTRLAISSPPAILIHTIDGSRGKAWEVARRVTGLMIGAASKKVVDSATLKPLITSPRATGTFPHSHTGINVPKREIESRLSSGRLGRSWRIRCVGAKRRTMTETKAPRITKGRASTTILNAKVIRSCNLVGNERPNTFVAAAFSHSRSVPTRPTPIKSIRKRITAHLLSLMASVFCMPAWYQERVSLIESQALKVGLRNYGTINLAFV